MTLLRGAAFLALAAALAACDQRTPEERAEAEIVERATEIHDRVLTLDSHIDIPFSFATPVVDPGVDGDFQVDLPKMRTGGLDVGVFIVYVGQTERTPENEAQAKVDAGVKFDAIHRMAEELHPDEIEIAYTAGEVHRIAADGKLVAHQRPIKVGRIVGDDYPVLEGPTPGEQVVISGSQKLVDGASVAPAPESPKP